MKKTWIIYELVSYFLNSSSSAVIVGTVQGTASSMVAPAVDFISNKTLLEFQGGFSSKEAAEDWLGKNTIGNKEFVILERYSL